MSSTESVVGSVAFVTLWSAAGALAGCFFGFVRHLEQSGKWRGSSALTATVLVLVGFLTLVVAASEISGRIPLHPWSKVVALVSAALAVLAAFAVILNMLRARPEPGR